MQNFPITTPVISPNGKVQVYGYKPHTGEPGENLAVLTAVHLDPSSNFIRIKFGDVPLETTFGNDLEGAMPNIPAGMTLMKMRAKIPPVANRQMRVPLFVEVLRSGSDKVVDRIQFGEFTYATGKFSVI